jgi:hypothetical protein
LPCETSICNRLRQRPFTWRSRSCNQIFTICEYNHSLVRG